MNQGVYIALSGAKLQELRLETIANNLANSNTSGYKADEVTSRSFEFELDDELNGFEDFRDIRSIENLDLNDPYGSANGIYSKTVQVGVNFSQGFHKFTGDPLNIALDGPGFIVIKTPNGDRYTRQGSYALNNDGELVTTDGFLVRGKGLTKLDQGELSFDADGNVLVGGKQTGSIDIVEFDDPHILRKEGRDLFALTLEGNFAKKAKNTDVKQGFLEQPNIEVVKEIVKLIEVNRLYESYQKTINSIDESTRKLLTV